LGSEFVDKTTDIDGKTPPISEALSVFPFASLRVRVIFEAVPAINDRGTFESVEFAALIEAEPIGINQGPWTPEGAVAWTLFTSTPRDSEEDLRIIGVREHVYWPITTLEVHALLVFPVRVIKTASMPAGFSVIQFRNWSRSWTVALIGDPTLALLGGNGLVTTTEANGFTSSADFTVQLFGSDTGVPPDTVKATVYVPASGIFKIPPKLPTVEFHTIRFAAKTVPYRAVRFAISSADPRRDAASLSDWNVAVIPNKLVFTLDPSMVEFPESRTEKRTVIGVPALRIVGVLAIEEILTVLSVPWETVRLKPLLITVVSDIDSLITTLYVPERRAAAWIWYNPFVPIDELVLVNTYGVKHEVHVKTPVKESPPDCMLLPLESLAWTRTETVDPKLMDPDGTVATLSSGAKELGSIVIVRKLVPPPINRPVNNRSGAIRPRTCEGELHVKSNVDWGFSPVRAKSIRM
jgi:hypothetical protein